MRDLLYRLSDFARTRGFLIGAAVVAVVAVVGVVTAIVLVSTSGGDDRVIPEGYTEKPTVAEVDTTQPRPATPAPAEKPPLIFAEGECKTLLDDVRAVMDAYPSGLVLGEQGAAELNAALEPLNAAGSACDMEVVSAFNVQELSPWMNYLAPSTPAN
jgi:hypothetical protein